MSERLAGSAGPHVFVETLDAPTVSEQDLAHLTRSLRMRDGDPLTISDGDGRWCPATLSSGGALTRSGEIVTIAQPDAPVTVAFSLTKSSKPEWVIQKLTELGVDHIVALQSERTIVRWDEAKVEKALLRWDRIAIEAAMQSHRVRLPGIEGVLPAADWLASSDTAIAHFDGQPLSEAVSRVGAIAIGPEGGWSSSELAAASETLSLGATVLRAETAAVAAGALLMAART